MTEKQSIIISGNHYADLIRLPCFGSLKKNRKGELELHVYVDYFDGHPAKYRNLRADIGDTLVEYGNGEWGLIRKKAMYNN